MTKPALIPVAEALEQILASLQPIDHTELVPLVDAVGRITASAVHSPINVPPHRNSAMDGYAVRSEDLPQEGETWLQRIGQSLAGAPFDGRVAAGQCVRIMTGGVVPQGADTIIMQEDTACGDDLVRIGTGHQPGQHLRQPGEDIAQGSEVLVAGQRLRVVDIGLAASLGMANLRVIRPLRVAVCSTGDELRTAGQPLDQGQIYDSNRQMLLAALNQPGYTVTDLGIIPDDRERIRDAFAQAAAAQDVIIATGGVSVGTADFVKSVLEEIGQVQFWRIAMKPGKPLAYGRIGEACFFGLPGNPVSTLVTFREFVLPALRRLAGQQDPGYLRFRVPVLEEFRKAPGRMEFQRGKLAVDAQGQLGVSGTGGQGSHLLTSVGKADCLVLLDEASSGVHEGETVLIEPLGERL